MYNKNKKQTNLIWLPVILLPVSNIVLAVITQTSVLAPFTEYSNDSSVLPLGAMYIIGAAAEELFFRWYLLKNVMFTKTELKPVVSIIIVSALFAGMHLLNLRSGAGLPDTLLQMLCAFGFSIWAGAVTWKSTWLIPLLAHVLMNATSAAEIPWVSLPVSAVVLADGIILMREESCTTDCCGY